MNLEGIATEVEDVVGFTLKELAQIYAIPGAGAAIDKLFQAMKRGKIEPSALELFVEAGETKIFTDEIERDFPNGGKV